MLPIFFDPLYLVLIVVTMALSGGAQFYLMQTYGKWSKVANGANLTGTEVGFQIITKTDLGTNEPGARPVMRRGGVDIEGLRLERIAGTLTDHYDPSSNTVRMSDAVADQRSVVAMAVIAHELGHAQQYQLKSPLIAMRGFLLPALRFSPMVSYVLIIAGLIVAGTFGQQLFWLGILFFGVSVLFSVLTMPVEIDASMRGMRLLRESGVMKTDQDAQGAKAVLIAAASTYLAAAISSVLQLLYYISLARRSG